MSFAVVNRVRGGISGMLCLRLIFRDRKDRFAGVWVDVAQRKSYAKRVPRKW